MHGYMTTSEAALYLRIKERTLYDLVASGAIPHARVTGKLLFPRRLIDRWIEANVAPRHQALAQPPAVMAGSSDPLLDWSLREAGSGLATLFEGSSRGIDRLADGEAMAAGIHVIDAESGVYNVEAVRARAALFDTVLIEWAKRQQGLVVARGNPLAIRTMADAARTRVKLRQPGAGAAVLFDLLLAEAGIDPAVLTVAQGPALTESDIAQAVLQGAADCGMAIGAAALAHGLDFVPLKIERFDLAMHRRSYFTEPIQKLMAFTRSNTFRDKADVLGSYDIRATGSVSWNA